MQFNKPKMRVMSTDRMISLMNIYLDIEKKNNDT